MSDSVKYLILASSFAVLAISFLIGLWARRKVTSPEAFFGGAKIFGPLTVGLATMQAFGISSALQAQQIGGGALVINPGAERPIRQLQLLIDGEVVIYLVDSLQLREAGLAAGQVVRAECGGQEGAGLVGAQEPVLREDLGAGLEDLCSRPREDAAFATRSRCTKLDAKQIFATVEDRLDRAGIEVAGEGRDHCQPGRHRPGRLLAVVESMDNGKPIRESRDIDVPLLRRDAQFQFDGVGALRVTIINPLTTPDHLDQLLDALREKNVPIAVASDCNPGTSNIETMPFVVALAGRDIRRLAALRRSVQLQ